MRSLTNDTLTRATNGQPEPAVGMGATLVSYSDRHAATINDVRSLDYVRWDCLISVTQDDAKVVKGSVHDGSAEYEFTPRPDGHTQHFARRRGTGRWDNVKQLPNGRYASKDAGSGLAIGFRSEYQDPHF